MATFKFHYIHTVEVDAEDEVEARDLIESGMILGESTRVRVETEEDTYLESYGYTDSDIY